MCYIKQFGGFPDTSVGKESACNAGDPGSIPGLGRSPGEGKGYPLQYSGGFLPRHDEDLREPLVRRQGSQVSMRVAKGSASWLSSHGRGLGPRDALKKDCRGLRRVDSLSAKPQGSPRILEWVAHPFSRGSSQPRNGTGVSCIAGGFFTV